MSFHKKCLGYRILKALSKSKADVFMYIRSRNEKQSQINERARKSNENKNDHTLTWILKLYIAFIWIDYMNECVCLCAVTFPLWYYFSYKKRCMWLLVYTVSEHGEMKSKHKVPKFTSIRVCLERVRCNRSKLYRYTGTQRETTTTTLTAAYEKNIESLSPSHSLLTPLRAYFY